MRTKLLVCCCLALVAGCGTSGREPAVRAREASSHPVGTGARAPALLKAPHRLTAADAAFVSRVPSAVRPVRGSAVRVPTPPGALGRYWLAPWPHPTRPGRPSFCLYSAGPGDEGPATQCFDPGLYRTGQAYALSARRGHVELVGFNPDPRGTAALRYAHRTVPLRVAGDVFVAASAARPRQLELAFFGRRVAIPIRLPAHLP